MRGGSRNGLIVLRKAGERGRPEPGSREGGQTVNGTVEGKHGGYSEIRKRVHETTTDSTDRSPATAGTVDGAESVSGYRVGQGSLWAGAQGQRAGDRWADRGQLRGKFGEQSPEFAEPSQERQL